MTANKTFEAKHPRGVTGQFVDKSQTAPEVGLYLHGSDLKQRVRDLSRTAKHVSPIATVARDDPSSTSGIDSWWNDHFATAEYGAAGTGYPKMPDDYGSTTHGRSVNGLRRVSRMKYNVGPVTLRMPAASKIRKYASQTKSTFDVPVSAETGNGSVSGWLRVTKNGNHYAVQAIGFPKGSTQGALVAESAMLTLEGRGRSASLQTAQDIMAERQARFAAGGGKVLTAKNRSSCFDQVGYDKRTHRLMVSFAGGRRYGYEGVSENLANEFIRSPKMGSAYNELIKHRRRPTKITVCSKCGRFFKVGTMHRCPAHHTTVPTKPQRTNVAYRDKIVERLSA